MTAGDASSVSGVPAISCGGSGSAAFIEAPLWEPPTCVSEPVSFSVAASSYFCVLWDRLRHRKNARPPRRARRRTMPITMPAIAPALSDEVLLFSLAEGDFIVMRFAAGSGSGHVAGATVKLAL